MTTKENQLITRFDDIYNLPDCRAYYREMFVTQYQNAHHSRSAFRSTLAELQRVRNISHPRVMDFASGYGIGALLLRHDISLQQVLDRYQEEKFTDATVNQVIEWDRNWHAASRDDEGQIDIFGIDVADRALEYGVQAGVYDAAYAIDLQSEKPSAELAERIGKCDLIIEVGSVAHMLPGTLQCILDHCGEKLPWIVTSPIRGNESSESMEIMRKAGYEVEAMPIAPFQHRVFVDDAEQERAIKLVSERGFETEGVETTGFYHAQLYLSRPSEELSVVSDWL